MVLIKQDKKKVVNGYVYGNFNCFNKRKHEKKSNKLF